MRPIRLASLAAVAVLAAACTGGGAAPSWSFAAPQGSAVTMTAAPVTPGPATEPPASVAESPAPAAATRVEVTLSDALKIEPAAMTVPAGMPVTFVVHNTGTVLHEFTLGDMTEQTAHEAEMMANGGMTMAKDEPMAIGVEPGATKELTVTFDSPGSMFAACHVSGHWKAGMQATITIQ